MVFVIEILIKLACIVRIYLSGRKTSIWDGHYIQIKNYEQIMILQ